MLLFYKKVKNNFIGTTKKKHTSPFVYNMGQKFHLGLLQNPSDLVSDGQRALPLTLCDITDFQKL